VVVGSRDKGGCSNDTLGELGMIVEKMKREGGTEGWRKGGREGTDLGFPDVLAGDDDVGAKFAALVHLGQRGHDWHEY